VPEGAVAWTQGDAVEVSDGVVLLVKELIGAGVGVGEPVVELEGASVAVLR